MAAAVDPIIIIDTTGTIVESNQACEKLLGYTQQALLGKNISMLMPAEIGALHNGFIQDHLTTGETKVIGGGRDVQVIHKDGEQISCYLSVSRVDTEQGVFFTGILRSSDALVKARKTINQLALVAKETDNSVIITDAKGNIEWVNRGFEKLTGYQLQEVIGKQPGIVLQGPQTNPNEVKKIRQALEKRKSVESTLINYNKNRQPYWVSMNIQPAIDETDGSCHFVSVQKNMTLQRKYETLLERQLTFFRFFNQWAAYSTSSPNLEAILSPLLDLTRFAKILITLTETSERRKNTIYAGNDVLLNDLSSDPFFQSVIEKRAPLFAIDLSELPLDNPDYHYLGIPIIAGEQVFGVLGGFFKKQENLVAKGLQDILQVTTNQIARLLENAQYKQNLEETIERFERGQHYAKIGTWDWNIETGDLYWSSHIGPLFGYKERKISTSYENFINAIHPSDRQLVIRAIDRCIHHGEPYDIDHRVIWPDGSTHWLNEKGNVVRGEDGKPSHMLGVVQDIEKIKIAEKTIIEEQFKAEKANKAKSDFLSSMSHELRTPLNSILGFSQLLLADDLSDDQKDSLQLIYKSGKHLLELVNDILDLAKLDSGKQKINIQDVGLDNIIQQCISVLSSQIETKELQVNVLCEEAHPLVLGDELRIKQVILNLLSNAIKYNRQGGSVEISCETTQENYLRMHVKDTGYGIPKNKLNSIFKPFNRLGYENSSIEGAGVGLYITKNMLEHMEGNLGVASEEGIGTDFWFELPLSEKQSIKNTSSQLENNTQRDSSLLDGLSILYVEDNAMNRLVLKKLLKTKLQADYTEANTVEEALQAIKQTKPDVVLLDLHLPDGNGKTVCEEIRKVYGNDVKVIAVTADAISPLDINNESAQFDEIEYKPINVMSLLSKLNKLSPA